MSREYCRITQAHPNSRAYWKNTLEILDLSHTIAIDCTTNFTYAAPYVPISAMPSANSEFWQSDLIFHLYLPVRVYARVPYDGD